MFAMWPYAVSRILICKVRPYRFFTGVQFLALVGFARNLIHHRED